MTVPAGKRRGGGSPAGPLLGGTGSRGATAAGRGPGWTGGGRAFVDLRMARFWAPNSRASKPAVLHAGFVAR